jgi:hypothetical protein
MADVAGRFFRLVRLDADNVPLVGCTGSCAQGHAACDCELAAYIAPDADRVIAAPPPLTEDTRARLKRRALYLIALGFAALGGLLGIAQARWEP